MMFRRILAAALAVFVFCAASPAARAQVIPTQSATVLAGAKKDLYPRAVMALDFAGVGTGGTPWYKAGGAISTQPSTLRGYTFSRALAAYAEDIEGKLTLFPAGSPRVTNKGVLIEEARTNVLLRSQEFDNATWSKTNATVSADTATAPDGSTTADKLIASAGSAQHYVSQTVAGLSAGEARTISVYAKFAGVQYLAIYMSQGPTQAWFDLQAGTVSNVTGSATITPLGNGWYRCTVTSASAPGASDTYELHTAGTAGSFTHTGDGVGGVFIWGGQLERQAAFATSLIQTTSVAVTRPADVFSLAHTVPSAGAVLAIATPSPTNVGSPRIVGANSGAVTYLYQTSVAANNFGTYNGSTTVIRSGNAAVGSVSAGVSWDGTNRSVTYNGGTPATSTGSISNGSVASIFVGSDNGVNQFWNTYIQRILIAAQAMSDAELQAATMPGETSALRLDFARGSYKNAAGYVRTNLLLESQTFHTASWPKGGATVSQDVIAAPNGTLTADKLVESATTAQHRVLQNVTHAAGVYTYSIYAKAGERSWLFLQQDGIPTGQFFDLSSGALGNATGTAPVAGIVPVGGGWYRCWMTYTAAAGTPAVYAMVASSNGVSNYAGDGASGLYIWGADLKAAGYLSSYIETGASVAAVTTFSSTNPADVGNMTFTRASTGYAEDASGNLVLFGSNVPRITNKGVLIEPAATQLATNPANVTASPWGDIGSTSTALGLSADGVFTAASVASNGQTWHRRGSGNITWTAGTAYAITAWYRAGSSGNVYIELRDVPNTTGSAVAGPVGSPSVQFQGAGTITNVSTTAFPNGRYKTSFIFTPSGSGVAVGPGVGPYSSTVGATVILEGVQVEVGSTPTSLVASGTRQADLFYYTALSLPSSSTLVGSAIGPLYQTNIGRIAELADGSAQTLNIGSGNGIRDAYVGGAGLTSAPVGSGVTFPAPTIASAANNGGTVRGSGNGAAATALVGTSTMTNPVRLTVGDVVGALRPLYGYVQQLGVYAYPANDNEQRYRSAGNF